MRLLSHLSKNSKLYIILAILYLASGFILPTFNTARVAYDLTEGQYQLLLFIVRLPILAVWVLAFYAHRRLAHYTAAIKDAPESKHFAAINTGVGWIAWGLLVPAIISALFTGLAAISDNFRTLALITHIYMSVAVSVFAFSYICNGAHRLAQDNNVQLTTKQIKTLVLILVTFGVLFCWLIAQRLTGGLWNSFNAYYLPNILIWITVVIPQLYAWFIGLFAAVELISIARQTPGIIYRQALMNLAIGLVVAIVSLCMLMYLRSIIPRTGTLTIGFALLAAYGIYALNAFGSILVALGANRLKKIEEI